MTFRKTRFTAFLSVLMIAGSVAGTAVNPKLRFDLPKKHCETARMAKAAPVVPEKIVYAWATRDRGNVPTGIVSFSLGTPGALTSVHPMDNRAYAGCYANGKYYFDRYRTYTENGESTWAHIALSTIDLATGKVTDVKDWSNETFVINDMTYDYTTGMIYAMGRNIYQDDILTSLVFEYSSLMTINPNTGVATEVKQFIDWPNGALVNPTYYTIACDLNGDIYTIDKNGYLLKLDRDNDYAEVAIGFTGRYPGQSTQSMEFDHSTGALYWCADYNSDVADLVLVDTASGDGSVIGETGTDSHLVGLYIPFDEPSQAAPGAVSDFKAEPDASGQNKISLSWVNPVKSFGGYNLATISSVKVYRNDELVETFGSATPGQAMGYVDEVPVGGLYSYSVVACNSAGDGLHSAKTRWVGMDVPMAVGNLGIGKNDDGSALLTWDAPAEGVHGGVIDTQSLGYKITRFPDGVVVASDCRENGYTDNTISGMNRYYYIVESHTAQGIGESAKSVEIALGSVVEKFPWSTLFSDQSEFGLWAVLNCNGGSTWKWKSRSAGGYEAFAMYEYDNNNTGDDYLISPDLLLKKGASYRLKFGYSGSNANYTEKLEVTFGKGKTAEAQSEVLKSLQIKTGDISFCEIDLPAIEETGLYNFAFHAVSDPKQYNIYVTDVSLVQTVAGTDDPDDEYDFAAPWNLTADVDNSSASVTLAWNNDDVRPMTENISEGFEDMTNWEINPAGSYGWTYLDLDGGIPYRSDYADMPYPTDGKPLAAMVMAPYELSQEVYQVNPPHDGDKYLLFKSNFSQGDGTRPAPAPDDWFISPELNFGSDFIFRFYCKADPDYESVTAGFGDPWNTEQFRVGYSLTDNTPESFLWMTDGNEKVTTAFDEWTKKEYSVPKEAKYVCIHYCTPSEGFWFMVDDVFIGVEAQTAGIRPALSASAPTFKYYDVYLDDVKVASTTETEMTIGDVADGSHVGKVVAVYEEGISSPAVVYFVMASVGIADAGVMDFDVNYDPAGREVRFGGVADYAVLYNAAGAVVAQVTDQASADVSGLAPGLYLLRLCAGNSVQTFKVAVR